MILIDSNTSIHLYVNVNMIVHTSHSAYLLVAVNIALLGANGYNVARRVKYDMDQKQNDTVIEVVE